MLRLGIVGLGLAGGVMVAAAKTHPEIRLVGAADPHDEIRARFSAAESLPAYASIEELLAAGRVDAVYIATPHQLHREHAVAAAQAGVHVIVEKPMALSVEDCDAIVAAAEMNDVCLVVGHTHGFSPGVREIARLVGTGGYGEVGLIALWNYTDFLYRPRRPEELDTSRGGGVLYNQVPHQVDIVRTISSAPVRSVRAVASVLDPGRPTEGLCTALLELADGAVASLVYSGYDHFDSDELAGWVAEGGGVKQPGHGGARRSLAGLSAAAEVQARSTRMSYGARRAARPAHQPHFGELVVTCAGADFRITADAVTAYTDHGVELHQLPATRWWPGRGDVLQELVEAVGGQAIRHDGRFGRETVRVCRAISESARRHREVFLPDRERTAADAVRT